MTIRNLIVCLVFVFATVGAVWTSGSGDQSAAGREKIEIDFMCNGDPTNQEMYQAWIKGFSAKYPNIQVNYFPFPEGGWAKVRATFAGGTAADIVRLNDDDVYDLGRLKKVIELDPYIDKYLDRKDFYGAAFEALSLDGKSYSANLAFGPNVFHYNTKMVADAGIKAPTSWDDAWEWAEFKEAIAKLTVDKDGDGRPEIYGAGWELSMITPFLYSNGTNPLPRGVEVADFMQPKLIEIMQEYSDLTSKHNWGAPVEEILNRTLLLNSNKLAMTWSGESIVPQLSPDLQWDIMPMPKAKEKALSVSFVRSFGIPAWSKQPDAAFRFYEYVWSDEGQKIMIDFGFGVPVRRSAAENIYNANPMPKHRAVYADQLDHDAPLAKDALGAVWKKYATHELGGELMNGNKTAVEFLQFIQEAMETRMKELARE